MSVLALLIGMFLPLQAAINNVLKTDVGDSTLLAAFVSFGVGTLTLLLFSVATRQPFHALSYFWLSLSVSRSTGGMFTKRAQYRDATARKLTREQLKIAQQMTREWEAKHPWK
jgi:hypothetical protein